MLSNVLEAYNQLSSIWSYIAYIGIAWVFLIGSLALYLYSAILKQVPMFLAAILCMGMTFLGGRLLGVEEGTQNTLNIVAIQAQKDKELAETKILELADELNAISSKLEESENKQKLQHKESQQVLDTVIKQLTEKAKEPNNAAGKGELAVVDDGTRCLSVTVPSDILRVLRENETRSLLDNSGISESPATSKSQ